MATSIEIRGVTYPNTPFIESPIVNGGGNKRKFWDTSDANGGAAKMLNGYSMYGPNGKENGSIQSKAAATYLPSGSDQSIAADQYLAGAQTIKAVTTNNLLAAYILKDVVVEVGCADDSDSVTRVTGALDVPVIVQDPVTMGVSIS